MWLLLDKCAKGLLSVVLPVSCACCGCAVGGLAEGSVCESCWQKVRRPDFRRACCRRCTKPYPVEIAECDLCKDLAFRKAVYCGVYEGAIRNVVLELKTLPHLPKKAKQLLFDTYLEASLSCDVIVPVPLHPDRLKERGYNQAEVIAKALSQMTGIEVDSISLIRVRKTVKNRAWATRTDRIRELKGAFRICKPRRIANRSVLLIDDLYTTGSTATACAQALLDSGAKDVSVITLARRL
ncbi:MAG: ComF family protein [Acidobacteriota bacterium]|nr:ComF family protein [Blastocatellia bacterium]MDW8412577.1 ComF family protein [Acidobacteriota bacterium]